MPFKKLEFTNDAGQKLSARIDLPADIQPVAYALFAHCFTCSKNIKAASHPKSFISLDQADHLLMDPRDSQYVGSLIAIWATKYIDVIVK